MSLYHFSFAIQWRQRDVFSKTHHSVILRSNIKETSIWIHDIELKHNTGKLESPSTPSAYLGASYKAMVRSPSRFRGTIALVCIASFVSLLPFTTNFVGTPLSRTSATSEPKSTPVENSLRPRTARRFFGGESEVDRLQRENAELKKKLGETQNGQGGGIIEKIGNGIKSLFGGEKKDSAPLSQPSSFPGTLGLLGSFLQPAIRMMGSLLKDSQDDIQTVLAEAESILTRSGRLGSRVTCGPIFSQSYSSMNINGQQSTRVQLQFQAKGDQRTGTASCSASIGPDGVNFQNLSLDGQPIDTSGPSASAGNVIDVERWFVKLRYCFFNVWFCSSLLRSTVKLTEKKWPLMTLLRVGTDESNSFSMA